MIIFVPLYIIFMVIGFVISHDARARGMNGLGWGVFTAVAPVIGLILYVIVRKPREYVIVRKPREYVIMRKPREYVIMRKPREYVIMRKPREGAAKV